MHIEYEVRALNIDQKEIIKKIEELGGKKIGEYDYKRIVYDFNPIQENKWIRLRTNGKETTLTIKKIDSYDIDGTKETEVVVSDFEETNLILNELGYYSRSYQENKRIQYKLNDIELDIDTWPYIPTYLEIEGKNEKSVTDMIELLNLSDYTITSLNVQNIYLEIYKINILKIRDLKFGEKIDKRFLIGEGE